MTFLSNQFAPEKKDKLGFLSGGDSGDSRNLKNFTPTMIVGEPPCGKAKVGAGTAGTCWTGLGEFPERGTAGGGIAAWAAAS